MMNVRTLALALATLLALTGFAAAQDPGSSPPPGGSGGDGTHSSSHPPPPPSCPPGNPCNNPQFRDCMGHATTDDARRGCVDQYCTNERNNDWCRKYCQENPGRAACKGDGAPSRDCLRAAGDDPKSREACKQYCKGHTDECQQFCSNHPDAPMCAFKPSGDERHISFQPAADGLSNLTVGGRLILASVRMEANETLDSSHTDHTLLVAAGDNRLELHDDAAAFLRFEGPNATVTLVFPAGVTHEIGPAGHKAFVHYPGAWGALIESDHMVWLDDHTVALTQFFSFHVTMAKSDGQGQSNLHQKVKDAIEKGDKVGAEIHVNKGKESEVFAYDRVNVTLRTSANAPTPADPLRITLSSDLNEGRTIVLHINKTVLDVAEGKVKLRYFDLPDGINGTARTEVVFQQASSLDDILDPSNDNGQPEYWVVRDANGLEVIVSVPHWSVHMVELSGLADLVQPSVLIGIAAGAGAVALAAIALFVPRRRDE